MPERYDIGFNVVESGSKTGHVNVTFSDPTNTITIGANTVDDANRLGLLSSYVNPNDGIVKKEDNTGKPNVTGWMHVSKEEYGKALDYANSKKGYYNYAPFTEACVDFAQDVYEKTGRKGFFGSLFTPVQPEEIHSMGLLVTVRLPGLTTPKTINIMGVDIDTETGRSPQCFPAHTLITMADGSQKAIADIQVSDEVMAYDAFSHHHERISIIGQATFNHEQTSHRGRTKFAARRVSRLYRNETKEWIKLSWTEDGEHKELISTPGHHFLDEFQECRMAA